MLPVCARGKVPWDRGACRHSGKRDVNPDKPVSEHLFHAIPVFVFRAMVETRHLNLFLPPAGRSRQSAVILQPGFAAEAEVGADAGAHVVAVQVEHRNIAIDEALLQPPGERGLARTGTAKQARTLWNWS